MQPFAASLVEDPTHGFRDVLQPSGVLDRSAAHDLREGISRALSRGPAALVVDLANISDVDAAGLDVLVYACRAATAAHVKLVLCSLPPLVLELLEPTRLSELGDVAIEPTMPIPLHGSGSWISGFEVAAGRDDGYELRGHSDRTALPTTSPLDDLRVEHL
jgi:anti-anti-sigma factor